MIMLDTGVLNGEDGRGQPLGAKNIKEKNKHVDIPKLFYLLNSGCLTLNKFTSPGENKIKKQKESPMS